MPALNPIEEECKSALSVILDLMGPGRRVVTANEHTELMGKVRDALHHLINKEFGCWSGKHTGACQCRPE
jgi:hypothetical protein